MKVGIFGAGQLGMMLGEAGQQLGLDVTCFSDEEAPCATRTAKYLRGALNDQVAVSAFASSQDVLTVEFENIPLETLRWAASISPLHPSPTVFSVAQDRKNEKELADSVGIPVPGYRAVATLRELQEAFSELGSKPAILKSRSLGYDGKGQARLSVVADCERAWREIGERPALLEELFAFEREISIIAVRSSHGERRFYPPAINSHRAGILVESIVDNQRTDRIRSKAEKLAENILEKISYVGVIGIELFEKSGELYLNEIAPRVHNTGHWSIEAARTSQFENHMRAITGMSLGETSVAERTVLFNIIGTVPDVAQLEKLPRCFVHLYGKSPRPGRKLGHVTLIGPTPATENTARKLVLG